MITEIAIYAGLFVTSLVAGTLLPFLPGSSEMALGGLLASHAGLPVMLIATAVTANIIGATVNYMLGRHLAHWAEHPRFPIPRAKVEKASDWFRHYGVWVLGVSFLPALGDVLTLVAGLTRANFRQFLALVSCAKLFGHLMIASGIVWAAG